MINIEQINGKTKTKFIGKKIHFYKSIDSTNLEAMRLIEAGNASSGDIVLAETQTSGRGQGENNWVSPNGNLYLSIITATKPSETTNLLTFVAGLAVLVTIKSLYGINIQLKWVNDIIFNNRKLGGILTEAKTNSSTSIIVTGIGINLNCIVSNVTESHFAPISLGEILSKKIEVNEFVAEFIENYENFFDLYQKDLESLRYLWKKNSYTLNKRISFTENNITYNGKAINIDKNGFLIVDVYTIKNKTIKSTKDSNIVYLTQVAD